MRATLLAGLLLAGCASTASYTRAQRPCQEEAVKTIWYGYYHRTDRPPDVWWVPRAAQTCGVPRPDGARGFIGANGTCVEGQAWKDSVDLVWYGDWALLAHELAHSALTRDGHPDPDHTSEMFRPGGAVSQATDGMAALRCQ